MAKYTCILIHTHRWFLMFWHKILFKGNHLEALCCEFWFFETFETRKFHFLLSSMSKLKKLYECSISGSFLAIMLVIMVMRQFAGGKNCKKQMCCCLRQKWCNVTCDSNPRSPSKHTFLHTHTCDRGCVSLYLVA